MDVIIESKKDGYSFQLEIGFFDTVLEIKEKIHKYHHAPVHMQSLYIRGAAMADDRDTEYYEVLEGSKIELIVVDQDEEEKHESSVGGGHEMVVLDVDQDEEENQESLLGGHEVVMLDVDQDEEEKQGSLMVGDEVVILDIDQDEEEKQGSLVGGHEVVVVEDDEDDKGKGKSMTFKITINAPDMGKRIVVDVEGGETVAQLKEMTGIVGSAAERTMLVVGGVEMQDEKKTLREYGVVEGTELILVGKAGLNRITVWVLVHRATVKIGVVVNVMERVMELRKELEKLEGSQVMVLPAEGYFFIHKQDLMEEERSFRWHGVKNGDTIDVFPGYVTDE